MTITEALKIAQKAPREAPRFSVILACGFTPLHLKTFLVAHLQQALEGRKVEVVPGLYGDISGTIHKASQDSPEGLAIVIEWSDLDPRLGYRGAGTWGIEAEADLPSSVRSVLERITGVIHTVPAGVPVVVSLPSLAPAPLFSTPGWRASRTELLLEKEIYTFAARWAESGRIAVLNPRSLSDQTAPGNRFDLKSDLTNGLPYTLAHADCCAAMLARALASPPVKKGIITDLDDTLWDGILGEVGPEGISWDLASHHQIHGIYQNLLGSLSDSGVLVGVASKNDTATVQRAFERPDLLLRANQVFPMEIHWNAKSGSVSRILKTWNVLADGVVFIDDSPMELHEVAAAHPGIQCLLFPKNDEAACLALFRQLRDMFGKARVSQDDRLRLESIRQGAVFHEQAGDEMVPERFLAQVKSRMTLDYLAGNKLRTLELVNKTNQFNLNGIRYTEGEWQKAITGPGAFVIGVNYEDKFGPLGTVGVLLGHKIGSIVYVDVWVMSCRAFARRIEYQCLKVLFESPDVEEIEFRFSATAKNGPTRDFFAGVLEQPPAPGLRLGREQFQRKCPALYHEVHEIKGAETYG